MTPGDLTLGDVISILKDVEATGQIDYIHVNGATNSTYKGYWAGHGDSTIIPMNFASLAKAIKAQVRIPIIASSMILHPLEAEGLLKSGACDLVSMTRAHIADAQIVEKAKAGDLDGIRPCVLCNQGCVGNHHKYGDIRCIHNAATGRERELGKGTIVQATGKKKIAVVGGGPAGLEFTRVAAIRGHTVDLFEKSDEVGGQLDLAGSFPWRQGLRDIALYLKEQVKRPGVTIWPRNEITQDDLLSMRDDYDAIVFATGAELYEPPIDDADNSVSILSLEDVIHAEKVADNILIVDADWRRNALAVAESLIQKGKKVTIISSGFLIGADIDMVTRTSYYSRIYDVATFRPLTTLEYLRDKRAGLRNVLNDKRFELSPIDQVVFVSGAKPRTALYDSIKDRFDNVFRIGDCLNAQGIPEAILAANRLARKL